MLFVGNICISKRKPVWRFGEHAPPLNITTVNKYVKKWSSDDILSIRCVDRVNKIKVAKNFSRLRNVLISSDFSILFVYSIQRRRHFYQLSLLPFLFVSTQTVCLFFLFTWLIKRFEFQVNYPKDGFYIMNILFYSEHISHLKWLSRFRCLESLVNGDSFREM